MAMVASAINNDYVFGIVNAICKSNNFSKVIAFFYW